MPLEAQALSTSGNRPYVIAAVAFAWPYPSMVFVSGGASPPLSNLSNSIRRSEPAFMDHERLMECRPTAVVRLAAGDVSPPASKRLAWH